MLERGVPGGAPPREERNNGADYSNYRKQLRKQLMLYFNNHHSTVAAHATDPSRQGREFLKDIDHLGTRPVRAHLGQPARSKRGPETKKKDLKKAHQKARKTKKRGC